MEGELRTECLIPVYDPNKPTPDWGSTSEEDAQKAKMAEQSKKAVKTYVLPWMGGRADGIRNNVKITEYTAGTIAGNVVDSVANVFDKTIGNPVIVNNTGSANNESKLCRLSMILGIASMVLMGTFFFGFVLAILGIVFGILGLKSNISDIEKKPAVKGIVFSGITMSMYIFILFEIVASFF
ncbi:MAG: DUF4190 domain-containing protein [Lachnospiraceae bacterium]